MRRLYTIPGRYTYLEDTVLKWKAKKLGLSTSAYIRKVLYENIPELTNPDILDLIKLEEESR
jgi:hypothetical protein